MLSLSIRESRDRVPCIHPAHWYPLSPAAGGGRLTAGQHWCYRCLRIHSTLRPIDCPSIDNAQLETAAVTTKSALATRPPEFAAPHHCPRLQILLQITVEIPPTLTQL